MSKIELYSAALCPFAHRTRLALAEKKLSVVEIEIDLRNKPPGFNELSPHGKVPLLVHDGRRVWESSVINEYLEETFPARPLLPKDPLARAQARIWINFADTHLYGPTGTMLHSADRELHARVIQQLADNLRFLEDNALAARPSDGPYLLGAQLSLADFALYPWFEQLAVLERYWQLQIPATCDRLKAWTQALAKLESVQSIAKPPGFYLEQYARLLEGSVPRG